MLLLFLSSLALANRCDPDPASDCARELEEVMEAMEENEPDVGLLEGDGSDESEEWTFPEGTVSGEDVLESIEYLGSIDATLSDAFGLLGDGKSRTLDADIVRGLIDDAGVDLSILPLELLEAVVIEGDVMEFQFDFEGSDSIEIRTPKASLLVLKENGKPKELKVGGQRIEVQDRVRFTLDETGVIGVEEGDLVGRTFVFSAGLDVRTVREEGRIAMADGYPVVLTDGDGEPVLVDGDVQFATYDDWLVISINDNPDDDTWVGIPPIF